MSVMVELEWLVSEDPQKLIKRVGTDKTGAHPGYDRKMRLFACACCRRLEHIAEEDDSRALSAAERYANGSATSVALARAGGALRRGTSYNGVWRC